MKGQIASLLVISVVASQSHAASQQMVWGKASQELPQYIQDKSSAKKGLMNAFVNQQKQAYQLTLQGANGNNNQHQRYQLEYKGIPVWGYQVIRHHFPGKEDTVTGTTISGIEKDLPSIQAQLSEDAAAKLVLANVKTAVKHQTIEKVIFIDDNQKAHLAYHLAYYTNSETQKIEVPNYLIDANDGSILKQWNDAHYEKVGQGLGGNSFPLPYRVGMFQHGNALPGLPSLGKFDVTVKNGKCTVESPAIKVINLENMALGYDVFPINVMDEVLLKLHAFSYPCEESGLFLNYSDGIAGPVNYAFSPVNDTMYFATETLNMYKTIYGVANPLGDDLPVRAYTHLGKMDNAFALPTIRVKGRLIAHQQIVIGNGDQYLTAPAQSVIAHELSHNFTANNSGLNYEGQSGGINEAFSDMAAIALLDFIRKDYPWYWDGQDWGLAPEAVIGGQPLRYMDDPSKDGKSINNSKDYHDDLDVHFSSGVFNRAFYLLAHKPGWSVQQAFQVMVDANMNYWSPIAYYDFAACGVIQAALDRNLDKKPVVEAFAEVGVICPLHKPN